MKKPPHFNLRKLHPGAQVFHPVFGTGVVTNVSPPWMLFLDVRIDFASSHKLRVGTGFVRERYHLYPAPETVEDDERDEPPDLERNAPVWVWDNYERKWKPRHFHRWAGWYGKTPVISVYRRGRTSHTSGKMPKVVRYPFWRLAPPQKD